MTARGCCARVRNGDALQKRLSGSFRNSLKPGLAMLSKVLVIKASPSRWGSCQRSMDDRLPPEGVLLARSSQEAQHAGR